MAKFRKFMHKTEEEDDISKTLNKIPPSHKDMVKGYRWKFHAGNTLNGDDKHVGYIDLKNREIAVAAPWNYGREFTILHEIAHLVWERLSDSVKQTWAKLVEQERKNMQKMDALNQSPEEIFCMVYASAHTKHPPVTYHNPKWMEFIRRICNTEDCQNAF